MIWTIRENMSMQSRNGRRDRVYEAADGLSEM